MNGEGWRANSEGRRAEGERERERRKKKYKIKRKEAGGVAAL
jgi:hypothetical protein